MARLFVVIITIFIFLKTPSTSFCQQPTIDILFDSIHTVVKSQIGTRDYDTVISFLEEYIHSSEYNGFKCHQKAMLNHRLGLAYYSSRNFSEALHVFSKQAMPVWESCQNHDKVLEANSIFNAAMSAQFVNQFGEAIPYLNESLSLYESNAKYPIIKLGQKYRGAGFLYRVAGEYELAELFYLKSLSCFEKSQTAQFQKAESYNDLGLLYKEQGNFEESIDNYVKSYEADERFQFNSSFNLADVYLEELNDFSKASQHAKIAYKAAVESGNNLSLIKASNIQGRVAYKRHDHDVAIDWYREALILCDSLIQNYPHVRERANIHLHLAEAYFQKGNYDIAHREVEKAILLILPNQSLYSSDMNVSNGIVIDRYDLIDMLSLKADLIFKQQNNSNSMTSIDEGLSLYYKIDTLFQLNLADISLNNSLIQASSAMSEFYETAVSRYLYQYERTGEKKYFESAFYFSSQLKALILTNALRAYKKLDDADDKTLRDMYSTLNKLLVEYYNEESKKDSLSSTIIATQIRIYDFEQSVKEKYGPVLKSFSGNDFNSLSEIQDNLNHDESLIEYFEGENSLYCFLIGKEQLGYNIVELTEENSQLMTQFINSCQHLNAQGFESLQHNARLLYTLLVEPLIVPIQHDVTKLIVIPDGLIHALPLEAVMVDKDNYLLSKFNIVYAYSHRLYFDKDSDSSGNRYIGFAPQYSSELSQKLIEQSLLKSGERLADLKMGIKEVQASSDKYLNKSIHIKEQATKEKFIELAESSDVLHLSLHGLVDYDVPDNSSLLFHDGVDDFVLNSAEITSLNLNPDLVILSSCHSAAGAITKGEGVQGLSRAFILAGSSSVMSSLWNASEYSSSEILPAFFEKLTSGKSKSLSLRESKLEYLENARPSLKHPFYWANYILISPSEVSSQSSFSMIAILLASLILLAIAYFFYKKSK